MQQCRMHKAFHNTEGIQRCETQGQFDATENEGH